MGALAKLLVMTLPTPSRRGAWKSVSNSCMLCLSTLHDPAINYDEATTAQVERIQKEARKPFVQLGIVS